MKLKREEIQHIAKLARIKLTEEEEELYTEQLSQILEYMQILQEVDTSLKEPTAQVTGLENVTREDVVASCSQKMREDIIEQFPEREGDLLKVKAVLKG